jgi:TolA-binding protein
MRTIVFSLCVLAALAARPAAGQQLAEDERIQFAAGLFSRGMYDLAGREYEAFLKASPQSTHAAVAHYWIGECRRLQTNAAAADQQYQLVCKNYPDHPLRFRAALQRAELYQTTGKTNEAAGLFQDLLKNDLPPALAAEALYHLGAAHRQAGRIADAMTALEQACTRHPGEQPFAASAALMLGTLYADPAAGVLHAPEKAPGFFQSVAQNPPDPRLGAEACFLLADYYFRLKNYTQSAEAYRQLLTRYPDDIRAGEARLQAAWANLNAGLYADALQTCDRQLAGRKDAPADETEEWLFLKAASERQLMKHADALETYSQLLEKFPQGAHAQAARYEKALTLYRAGRYADTITEAREILTNTTLRAHSAWLLAESYAALKDQDNAIQYYRLITREFPDDLMACDALYRLAHHLQSKQDYQEATRFYHLLAERFPSNGMAPSALFAAGLCATRRQQHEEAVRDWTRLLEAYPASEVASQALFQRAMGEIQLSRPADAQLSLYQFLKQYPDAPQAAEAGYWLGRLLADDKKWHDAEPVLRAALTRAPSAERDRDIRFYLGATLHNLGQFDEAANVLKLLLRTPAREKFTPPLLEWLAEYLHRHSQHADAAEAARLLTLMPQPGAKQAGFYLLGRAELAQKKEPKALEALRTALKQKAATRFAAEAALQLGEILRTQGDYRAAAGCFDDAARRANTDAQLETRARAYLGLARVAAAQKETDEALRYFMSIAVLFDDPVIVPQSLYEASETLRSLGRPEDAARMAGELKTRYPQSEWARRLK